jgi:hypothetical protein
MTAGRGRRARQFAQHRNVERGRARKIGKVDERDRVAVAVATLRADRPVLATIILRRLGEAHRGIAGVEEGNVIAAAFEAVRPTHCDYV